MEKWWPADIHLIGKDIVRFHTVYWPAFLMSAELPLPKQVFGHGFLLHRGEKMSKSLGNVVDPLELAETFGVDSLRYFLMREVSFGNDGSYSAEAIVTRCNAELANSFGNLAQRTLSMIFKNMGGILKAGLPQTEADAALLRRWPKALRRCARLCGAGFPPGWMPGCAAFSPATPMSTSRPLDAAQDRPGADGGGADGAAARGGDLALAVRPVVPTAIDKLLDQMGWRQPAMFATSSRINGLARFAAGLHPVAAGGRVPRLDLPADA
jgi:methionyl-tRNA synthetase